MTRVFLASSSPVKRRAVAQFFNTPLDSVVSVECGDLGLPPQPLGTGRECVKARFQHLCDQHYHLTGGDWLVAIENEVWGATDVCHVRVSHGGMHPSDGKSEGVPFQPKYLADALAQSPRELYRCAGLSVTVGACIAAANPAVEPQDWVGNASGVYASRADQIHAALADAVPGDRWKANLLAHRVAVHADFPRPGVRFKDLSPIIAHPSHFATLMHLAAAEVVHYNITKVVGLDARGFIYGAALAREVGAGFVMARKKGKLPGGGVGLAEVAYTTEYSSETLQLQAGSIAPGDCVVVCDDLVATGGSLKAACDLVTAAGGSVAACVVMAAVEPLRARAEALLGGIPIHVVLPEARQ